MGAGDSWLVKGEVLKLGQSLSSPGNWFLLKLKEDGNLVVFDIVNNGPPRVIWASGTNGQAVTQFKGGEDGNFVLEGPTGEVVWSTGMPTDQYSYQRDWRLVIQDDGNLVIYDHTQAVHWASNSNQDMSGLKLTLQSPFPYLFRYVPGTMLASDVALAVNSTSVTLNFADESSYGSRCSIVQKDGDSLSPMMVVAFIQPLIAARVFRNEPQEASKSPRQWIRVGYGVRSDHSLVLTSLHLEQPYS